MTTKMVFLSYSSKDRRLVTAVRGLLRASSSRVFQDNESIRPGMDWSVAILEAIAKATLMYVFWCKHASRSKEVRKEYEFAMQNGKKVVPVLLDSTPLSSELTVHHGVDFRDIAGHPRFSRLLKTVTAAGTIAILIAVAWLWPRAPTPRGLVIVERTDAN